MGDIDDEAGSGLDLESDDPLETEAGGAGVGIFAPPWCWDMDAWNVVSWADGTWGVKTLGGHLVQQRTDADDPMTLIAILMPIIHEASKTYKIGE